MVVVWKPLKRIESSAKNVSGSAKKFYEIWQSHKKVLWISNIVNKEFLAAKSGVDIVEKLPTQSLVEASKGLVHKIGLELCKRWPETVEAEGFPGLGHGDTLRDKNVMERWVKVLEKVNGDGEASMENIAALDNAVGNEIYV